MIEAETLAFVVDWISTLGLVSIVICVGFVLGLFWAGRMDE